MARKTTPQVFSVTTKTSTREPIQAKSKVPLQLVDRRTRFIRFRLQALERERSVLQSNQKWPTQKSTEAYYEKRFGELMGPKEERSISTELRFREFLKSTEELQRRLNPDALGFPFPLNRPGTLKPFTKFCLLPPEIRLQIWEMAFDHPRFIEAQFISEFRQEVFINCESTHVLLGVCRESREIAQDLKTKRRGSSGVEKLSMRQSSRYSQMNLELSLHEQQLEQLRTPAIHTSRSINFHPERDTVFFRCLNTAITGFSSENGQSSIPYMIDGLNTIQHLAIALKDRGLPRPHEWQNLLYALRALKTVTFLLGCEEKSWTGLKHVVLRDLEEWFVDGRDRLVSCDTGGKIDIRAVGSYMRRREFHRKHVHNHPRLSGARAGVMVRVVAWKRMDSA